MTNLLKIQHLSKKFNEKLVLKDISLEVKEGSIVGFIGDNGAGKSTTFKLVLGLLKKNNGTIHLFEKENFLEQTQQKEKLGVVFDAMNLPAHLTVSQLNKVFYKMFNNWNQKKFEQLLVNFSLPLNKKVGEFSRGMSMKLSVAVALSHHAKLLLLDEATGGLDPSSREELLNELQQFVRETKGGILLSSHIMSDVEKIASHLVFIKDGEILLKEEKQKVMNDFVIIELNDHQLAMLPKEIVVAKREYETCVKVLINDKDRVPKNISMNKVSIEEISVLLAKGVKA